MSINSKFKLEEIPEEERLALEIFQKEGYELFDRILEAQILSSPQKAYILGFIGMRFLACIFANLKSDDSKEIVWDFVRKKIEKLNTEEDDD